MSEIVDVLEKAISQIEDLTDDWEDVEDIEEFDMEAYWDADGSVTWDWESPWSLESISSQ